MRRVLTHPRSMIGSDGLPHDVRPHPRLWGTFPRVLGHYCRELGLLQLESAIFKMTSLPATQFGLKGRGRIAPDHIADITVFDAEKIRDCSSYADPERISEGVKLVFVNGKLAYTDQPGMPCSRNGRFIRRGQRGKP